MPKNDPTPNATRPEPKAATKPVEMLRVKMRTPMALARYTIAYGEEHDFPKSTALRLCWSGQATPVGFDIKAYPEPEPEPRLEKAVAAPVETREAGELRE